MEKLIQFIFENPLYPRDSAITNEDFNLFINRAFTTSERFNFEKSCYICKSPAYSKPSATGWFLIFLTILSVLHCQRETMFQLRVT